AGVPGDYNNNGVVDAADYVVWRSNVGAATIPNRGTGISGTVGSVDYDFWKAHFGNTSGSGSGLSSAAVPEPTTLALLVLCFGGVLAGRRGR
ncbi:MAG TPA: PEP-CTERM sorting domain-containing protein, partial [Lacipirellulaceae bacterium]|nr:PEP-CTERM sorting domain-containing protein [Lacipirellulaceae bacterium]